MTYGGRGCGARYFAFALAAFFASRTFRIFEYFAVTAVAYYVIVKLILGASRLLAARLFPY